MLSTPIKTLHLGSAPLAMIETAGHLIVAGNDYTFFFFDPKTLALVRSHRITSSFENLSPYHKGLQGSGELIHVPFSQKNLSTLLSSKKGLNKEATLGWHGDQVDACTFSRERMLVATGGADGQVFVHTVNGGQLITSFGREEQKVCSLTFDDRGRYLAAAFSDGTLVVFDLDLNTRQLVEPRLSAPIEALHFISGENRLFLLSRLGESAVCCLEKGTICSEAKLFSDWPSAIAASQDNTYLLVATRQSQLYFFRPADNAMTGEIHLQKGGVSLLKLMGDHLFIGYTDGTLEIMAITRELEAFKLALEFKNAEDARRIMLRQPFLMVHPAMSRFEQAWERAIEEATNHLANHNQKRADQAVAPFLFDPVKKARYKNLQENRFLFGRFSDALARRDYATAYHMADKNPVIRQLKSFNDLESYWLKACGKARKLIEQDAAGNRRHVTHLLAPFKDVPSKNKIVEGLIRNHKAYLEAKALLGKNDFEGFFELAEEHPYIKALDIYTRLYPLLSRVLDNARELEMRGQYPDALEMVFQIHTLAPFRVDADKMAKRLQKKEAFKALVARNCHTDAFSMVAEHDYLQETAEFEALNHAFQARSEEALQAAFEGQAQRVLDLLEPWLGVDYLQYKIASMVRISYLYEIKRALSERQPICIQSTIESYVTRFHKDAEITRICRDHKVDHLLDALTFETSPDGYLTHGLPDSILSRRAS
jgi:hypothetical protein